MIRRVRRPSSAAGVRVCSSQWAASTGCCVAATTLSSPATAPLCIWRKFWSISRHNRSSWRQRGARQQDDAYHSGPHSAGDPERQRAEQTAVGRDDCTGRRAADIHTILLPKKGHEVDEAGASQKSTQ